ncbi:MAG: Gfo/Idh/MocA family oxidoreductase [Patescibacteria group bacterium]
MEKKIIKICLAGYGNFGKRLNDCLGKIPHCQVKYIYHPEQEKARLYGELGSCDLKGILQDPEVDAFIIATPHDQHAKLLNTLVREGKHHIFVEKPITAFLKEAEALHDSMRSFKKVFMVGHNQRREACFRKAKELLDKKAIGSVVDVSFNFSHSGAYTIGPDNWRYYLARHREGPLVTLGSHAIDTIHYLFGRIKSVYARIQNISGRMEAPDCSAALMKLMDSDATVLLQSNYNVPSEKRCIISGIEGVIYIDRNEIELRTGRDINKVPSQKQRISILQVDTMQEELNEFFDAILNGKQIETGYREGLAVMVVLEACYQSSLKDMPEDLAKYYSYF